MKTDAYSLQLSDYVTVMNHLTHRISTIDQEITDTIDLQKGLLFIYQQKKLDDHIGNLRFEKAIVEGIYQYMKQLKGV